MVHGPGAIHTREPVTTLADLKGVKLRVGGGGVRLSEALGATPVTMPGSQAYEAIQKGVADGAMFPLEAVAGFRLYELVNHHLVIPGGLYTTPFALIMNRDRYESLSETQRAALDSVSGVKAAAILGRGWDEADENGRKAALENGGTITEISTEELAKMREAASVVTSNWIELANSRGLDGHVRVDLITQVVPASVRRWLDRLASVLLTLFIALATWKLWDKARSLHDDGIFTPILGIPVYPIGFVLAAAGAAAVAAALTVVVVGTKESDAFAQDLE